MTSTATPRPGVKAKAGRPARRGRRIAVPLQVRRPYGPGYSRFVSMMKFFLPSVALILIALVVVWPHLQTKDNTFRIGFAALKARETEDPAMVNARYLGTDRNNRLFSVTADLAKNLLDDSQAVELEMPKADITLEDGSWLVLTAETGVFERQQKTLQLVGAVNLFHDSGYEFRTTKALIDLTEGAATGNEPVQGHGPFGELRADGFRLADKGRTIIFTGKAKLVLYQGIGRPSQ